jgi:large subunit ribosomal protein L5
MNATAPTARLKTRYLEEIRPLLIGRFGYSSVMEAPRLEKITLNMGVGQAKQDSKVLRAALDQLAAIAGQQPSVRRARKSVAAFKLREGNPVGVAVTLRGERGYEFLDRLISIAIPRIRDFRGLSPRSFDGRGNYSLGVREQIIFPEVDYDAIDEVRGLDITITTTAASDVEAFALLSALGMPFAARGRPAGFDAAELGEAVDTDTDQTTIDAGTEQAAAEVQGPAAGVGVTEQAAAEQGAAEHGAVEQRAVEQDGTEGDGPDAPAAEARIVERDAARQEVPEQDGAEGDDAAAPAAEAASTEQGADHNGAPLAPDATGAETDSAEHRHGDAPAAAADAPGQDDTAKPNDAEEKDS